MSSTVSGAREQRGAVLLDLAAELLGVTRTVVAAAGPRTASARRRQESESFAAAPGAVWHGVAETDRHRRRRPTHCGSPDEASHRLGPTLPRGARIASSTCSSCVEVVPADNVVDVGQRGGHAPDERLVLRGSAAAG